MKQIGNTAHFTSLTQKTLNTLSIKLSFPSIFITSMQNIAHASIRAKHEAGQPKQYQQEVLVQHPVVLAEVVGPEGHDLDDGREDERQRGAADGAH